ncbi:MAG: nucleotide pyrophosphohydrolase [Bacteroidia bacterium]|nr:nucleotide pyrophosphohydrolase [Bacteroidia bacterium]MDW8134846.1 nucleotide pyrophosphohydrolase [Bacteroidia bacterium]
MIDSEKATDLSLSSLQTEVDRWIQQVGQGYFSVLTNTALLMEEVGELARLLARHYGDQSFKPGEDNSLQALAEEFADILFVLVCLANQTGIDLSAAFQASLRKKTERDRDRHAQRKKGHSPS